MPRKHEILKVEKVILDDYFKKSTEGNFDVCPNYPRLKRTN